MVVKCLSTTLREKWIGKVRNSVRLDGRMERFKGRFGQQELVADGHAMTEAPLHFGRPVSLRRVSDAESLHIGQMVGMYFHDF